MLGLLVFSVPKSASVCVNLHYTEFKTITEKPPVLQCFTVFAGYPSLIVGADYGTEYVAGVNGRVPP